MTMNNRKNWVWITIAFAVLGAASGCHSSEKKDEPVVTVKTAVAKKMPLNQTIAAEGIVFPKNQATITPKVSSPVKQFLVNRGARVHKGQLLAVLENRDLAASVTENRGALEQAQAAYETTTKASLPEDVSKAELDAKAAEESLEAQQKLYDSRLELFKQGALPRKDLDQASVALVQARAQSQLANQHLASMHAVGKQQTAKSAAGQLASAEGKYQGATAQLSYTEIRSPIDGVVTDRPLWPGETPAAGTPLLTLMDMSSVTARAHIPQEQAVQLKAGDAAVLTTSDGQIVNGKVSLVSPALDAGSTTVEVWVEAANKDGKLRPGSTVQMSMTARTIADAIAVPSESLVKTPEGDTALMVVAADHKAYLTPVEVGVRSGDMAQITKGLKEGQTVVTTGAYGLPDKTQVKTGGDEDEKSGDKKSGAADKDKD